MFAPAGASESPDPGHPRVAVCPAAISCGLMIVSTNWKTRPTRCANSCWPDARCPPTPRAQHSFLEGGLVRRERARVWVVWVGRPLRSERRASGLTCPSLPPVCLHCTSSPSTRTAVGGHATLCALLLAGAWGGPAGNRALALPSFLSPQPLRPAVACRRNATPRWARSSGGGSGRRATRHNGRIWGRHVC